MAYDKTAFSVTLMLMGILYNMLSEANGLSVYICVVSPTRTRLGCGTNGGGFIGQASVIRLQ